MERSSPEVERRRAVLGALFILAIVILGGGGLAIYMIMPRGDGSDQVKIPQLPNPDPPTQGYVGSAKCSECHQGIADQYAKHPKSHSLLPIADAKTIEDYEDQTRAPDFGARRYKVSRTDDLFAHHEFVLDREGKEIYDQAETLQYVLGSGKRERNYLLARDGVIMQSPIAWRVSDKKWILAEGFGERGRYFRFEKRIGEACLVCHSGRRNPAKRNTDRYGSPPFHETAISCERCHGPGDKHVVKQSGAPTAKGQADDSIVNPSRLDAQRANHICAECHMRGMHSMPRYGSAFADFRPGQLLDETRVIIGPVPKSDLEFEVSSPVDQMMASSCYLKSNGKMGCVSCHDPHSTPPPEKKAEFFNSRCNQCHSDKGCSLPEPERQQEPAKGSCIQCHMPVLENNLTPHSTQTDHRVRKRPVKAPRTGPRAIDPFSLVLFDGAEERIPARETQRIRGLAMMNDAVAVKKPDLARQAGRMILPIKSGEHLIVGISQIKEDIRALEAVADVFVLAQRMHEAEHCWETILNTEPDHEKTLSALVNASMDAQEPEDLVRFADALIAVNPNLAPIHSQRALALERIGRVEEAIESAKRSLEINPSHIRMYDWLERAYKRVGQTEKAKESREMARRLREVGLE